MLDEMLEELYRGQEASVELAKTAASLDEMSDEELRSLYDTLHTEEEKVASGELTHLQRDFVEADLWGRQLAHRQVVEAFLEAGDVEGLNKLSADLGVDLVKSAEQVGFSKAGK